MTLYPLVSTKMGVPSPAYTLQLAQTSWTPPQMPHVKHSCKGTSMAQHDVQCTPGPSISAHTKQAACGHKVYAQQSKSGEVWRMTWQTGQQIPAAVLLSKISKLQRRQALNGSKQACCIAVLTQ